MTTQLQLIIIINNNIIIIIIIKFHENPDRLYMSIDNGEADGQTDGRDDIYRPFLRLIGTRLKWYRV